MKLSDLNDIDTYEFRIGRAGEYDVIWGEWQKGKFYITKRETDLPKKYRNGARNWKAGDILTICPKDVVCAEFGRDDFDPQFKIFNCEDWYLEIKGLTD